MLNILGLKWQQNSQTNWPCYKLGTLMATKTMTGPHPSVQLNTRAKLARVTTFLLSSH